MKNEVGCFSLSLSFPEELGFWVACHAKRRCHLLIISVVAEFTKLSVHRNCVREFHSGTATFSFPCSPHFDYNTPSPT